MLPLRHSLAIAALLMFPLSAADHAGKASYDKACKACHGADGAGNPAIAKMLKVTLKDLGGAEVQGKSDADIKKDITVGSGKMKPVTALSAKQVDEVVGFVRTLKK